MLIRNWGISFLVAGRHSEATPGKEVFNAAPASSSFAILKPA